MSIGEYETELIGSWIWNEREHRMIEDETCRRIQLLVKGELQKVSTSKAGWEELYLNPRDGRYWELTYPRSEMHGGGPPTLRTIDPDNLKQKYGVEINR